MTIPLENTYENMYLNNVKDQSNFVSQQIGRDPSFLHIIGIFLLIVYKTQVLISILTWLETGVSGSCSLVVVGVLLELGLYANITGLPTFAFLALEKNEVDKDTYQLKIDRF